MVKERGGDHGNQYSSGNFLTLKNCQNEPSHKTTVDCVKEYGDRKSQDYKNQILTLKFDPEPSHKTTADV
ncbi:hypothetical protein PITCH_A50059 [uncultured Desulfobacterium sp.]|uniref:Uncharacterized protein n=1 Tax=uncultured Desulfobacterium sp. TaxID=201089 RepID=A0A445N0L0_9BACT|nr:hypothetical protein PITCH_A1560002 [uncultured Desulfobacterium sp.]SPD75257.1 hypothetical protein PITCH_A50059 [uncultured Desulfobacterium sp.]